MTFYPWHATFKNKIISQFQEQKLAHALLFSGPGYLGKFDFAQLLSRLFLCEDILAELPCGSCAACHLLAAGTHPDYRLIEPVDSKLIKIEQVRELIVWLGQTAQRSGFKIVIINPAQQMNHQSANALLKCLEEPTPNTLIFLITSQPGSLLPTIRSRCQQYSFHKPDQEMALDWLMEQYPEISKPKNLLDIADGLPLAVVNKLDKDYLARRLLVVTALITILTAQVNPVAEALKFSKHEMAEVFETCHAILADGIKFKLTRDLAVVKNSDMALEIERVGEACSNDLLFAAIKRIEADLKVLNGPTNPNKNFLLESLFVDLGSGQSNQILEFGL